MSAEVMPPEVAEVRAEVCGRCATPCEHQNEARFHADPCAGCPINEWGQYGQCEDVAPPSFGLGDAVAAFAQPIARAIDRLAGTKIANCGGCKERRAALNRIVPKL